jgi:hypothetical protein
MSPRHVLVGSLALVAALVLVELTGTNRAMVPRLRATKTTLAPSPIYFAVAVCAHAVSLFTLW